MLTVMELVLRLLVIWLLMLCCSSNSTSQQGSPLSSCYPLCECEDDWHILCVADASFVQNVSLFNRYLINSKAGVDTKVRFITHEETVPALVRRLPVVRNLSLRGNGISTIQEGAFSRMRLRELILSRNAISSIHPEAFSDLEYLTTLDLSHNQLVSLNKELFSRMPALEVLNLDHNALKFFPFDVSSVVPSLRVLMLNYNSLSHLLPTHLSSLSSLEILGLRKNSLTSFVVKTEEEMPSLQVLDVAENPFHCSCGIIGLKLLKETNHTTLMNPELTLCATPLSLLNRRVDSVVSYVKDCSQPSVHQEFNSRKVLYTSGVEVSCDVTGNPKPAVLWATPWGHDFADPSHLARLEDVCPYCQPHRKYHGAGIGLVSEVSVINQGQVLRITTFRGYFNGNVTCTAFSFLGNDSATRYIEVFSAIPLTILDSLVIGGFSAAGALCLGLIIGSIKLLFLACKKRFGPKLITHSPAPVSDLDNNASANCCKDDSIDFNDDFYPPETPFTTPVANSPATSPKKCHSPSEADTPPGGWLPAGIFDTMDEVRWRLRYGVGRKMTAVKKNVRSMKESGSVYVHNIMESGSTAANKVKAGVVMGMETVKYHVQSIKEFCGTGDMGGQTISMISVETNVDTNETREVIRSVTMV